MANPLSSWSPVHQKQLRATINSAKKDPDSYVVFDADNTIWKDDVTEGMMAWLEQKGVISLDGFADNLLPIPPKPMESVYGYYDRLCSQLGHSACYLWSAQAFQGVELNVMRSELKEMMATNDPMRVTCYHNDELTTIEIPVPKIFTAQVELIAELQKNDIDVWVVSASLEDLVRMVVSDPVFGILIPAEKVIGVNMLMHSPNGSVWASAQHRENGMVGDDYFTTDRLSGVLSHHIYAPATWYVGKVAAIQEWIHPHKRPMLVAGDSPNDFSMQFYANAKEGGTRLRIHRKDSHKKMLEEEKKKRSSSKNSLFDPKKGWLEVSF